MKPSKKFLRMSEIYKVFAKDWENVLDFTDEALLEMYKAESLGGIVPSPNNGFSHGKKWLNLNVEMWKEDISLGTLYKFELYDDPKFPHWWLDRVLAGIQQQSFFTIK